jgi:hypothetical protein
MNKTIKVMAISVVAAFFFALPLAAQTVLNVEGDPASNLRKSTVTLYKTDVDNFLSVNNWSSVSLDNKWFGYLHSTGGLSPNFRANVGYATKVGDLYLGLRYNGNIFQDTGGGYTKQVTLNPAYDEVTQQLTSLTETTAAWPAARWHSSTNQLDVLIGVAGQGIKVGFFESMAVRPDGYTSRAITKTDTRDGNIQYQNEPVEFSQFQGNLLPSVQWGTLLNVSGLTVKPRAGVSFLIYQNELVDNYYAGYTAFNGKPIAPRTLTRAAGNNNGYLQPEITVGADLGLPKKDNLATTFTLNYAVNFNVYDNDYSASGFSGKAAGPVSWGGAVATNYTETTTSISGKRTQTQTTLGFNDTSRSQHTITPIVTLDKTVSDALSLGLKIQAPITVTSTANEISTEIRRHTTVWNYAATNSADAKTVTEYTQHTPGNLTEITEFKLIPSVRIGARYHLFPGRFTVNAGIQLDPFGSDADNGWTNTVTKQTRNGTGQRTTETVKNGDGVVTSKTDTTTLGAGGAYNDVSTVQNTFAGFSGRIGAGFLFNFNENMALDFFANTGALSTTWSVDMASVNVMFTFKFGKSPRAAVERTNVERPVVAAQEENVNEENN